MDRVIFLQFGGSVNKQFELVGMRPHVLTFENPSSFNELVARVRAVINTDVVCVCTAGTIWGATD
jgi:hypothetical protein